MKTRSKPVSKTSVRVYRSFDGRRETTSQHTNRRNFALPSLEKLPSVRFRLKLILFSILTVLCLRVSYISRVVVINQPGLDDAPRVAAEDAVKSYMQSRPWRHFQLFISSPEIENAVRAKTPSISRAEVKRSLFSDTVSVRILPKQPSAVWQQGRGGQTYVIDETGRAFMKASGSEKLPKILSDQSFVNGAVTGQYVIDANAVKTVTSWGPELKKLGMELDVVEMGSVPRQADFVLKNKPYRIRVSTEVSAAEAAPYLAQMLKNLEDRKITPAEYIDIRIPYRVFYK